MKKYFANTSTLWAYEQISPYAGASHADLWRYCVLYIFGGVYFDDDAMIESPFDEVSEAFFQGLSL
jgi:mannosyltransferase OCH1-like enzyme